MLSTFEDLGPVTVKAKIEGWFVSSLAVKFEKSFANDTIKTAIKNNLILLVLVG